MFPIIISLQGNSTNVVTILNMICTSDIWSDTLSVACCSHETYGVNIVIIVNINTPIEQKITYESDVLLAAFVAPIEDITDVTVKNHYGDIFNECKEVEYCSDYFAKFDDLTDVVDPVGPSKGSSHVARAFKIRDSLFFGKFDRTINSAFDKHMRLVIKAKDMR